MRSRSLLYLISGLLALATSGLAQVQRIDPTPIFTTTGNTPPGTYTPVLAVPGASIQICNDPNCATIATTYADASGLTACPSYAPLTWAGTSSCVSVTDPQGNWGFWTSFGSSSAASTLYYTVTFPDGTFYGPFPVSASFTATGTYTAPGGGVPETVDTKLQQTVNVADYGAKCDGVTDDTAFIQSAIDYVSNSSTYGGTVTFPVTLSACAVASTVYVTRGVRLSGNGTVGTTLSAITGGTFATFDDTAQDGAICQTTGTHLCKAVVKVCFSKTDCVNTDQHFLSIEHMQIQANHLADVDIAALNFQELSTIHDVLLGGFLTYAVYVNGQNWSMDQLYLFADSTSTFAVGIKTGFVGTGYNVIKTVTFTGAGGSEPGAGIELDGCYGCHVDDIHVEHSAIGILVKNNGAGEIHNYFGNPTTPIGIQLGNINADTSVNNTWQWALFNINGGNSGSQLTVCDLTGPAYPTPTSSCGGIVGAAAIPNGKINVRVHTSNQLLTDSGEAQYMQNWGVNGNLTMGFGSEMSFTNSGVQTFSLDPAQNVLAVGFGGGTETGLNLTGYSKYGRVLTATVASTSTSTIVGTITQTCTVTFASSVTGHSATGTLALTGTNAIANGTAVTIVDGGQGYSTFPLNGVLSNGTATCSGSITFNSNGTVSVFSNGGGYLNGYAASNPSAMIVSGGASTDGSTATARATSAELLDMRNGSTTIYGNTGLTPGTVGYSATVRLTVGPNGTRLEGRTFSGLGAVPPAANLVYCLDCTTAATCAGGGSGHIAASNGTNWTCQ